MHRLHRCRRTLTCALSETGWSRGTRSAKVSSTSPARLYRGRGHRRSPVSRSSSRSALRSLAAAGLIATLAAPAVTAADPGFKTSSSPYLVPGSGAPSNTNIVPLLNVGDVVGDFMFDAIPDGIAVMPRGKGALSVFVNHETATVPFPYNLPPSASNQNDFTNSTVDEIKLHQRSAGVLNGRVVIPSEANYQRFCSNYLATEAEGFSRPILFTNEESLDWVNRTGTAWPATEGADEAREVGAVVAYDVKAEAYRTIWGMGRLNHENSVAIPGMGGPFLLTGDDTFTSDPAQSQVYAYAAGSAEAVWNDEGSLRAFVADDAAINDYYDFAIGSTTEVSGHFVDVPPAIAEGRNPDGTDMMAEDVPAELGGPYPEPPANGQWSRGPGQTSGPGIDGPQWVLEHWSDINNVFQFVRIEDIAYDKRPDKSNIVYLADSGRGATSAGLSAFTSSNGRIWQLELDASNPTENAKLSILIEGDDNPVKTLNEVHQPDNLETTPNGLYITEDPRSSQQFNADQQVSDAARATTARVWQYTFSNSALAPVLKVDQAADEDEGVDVDPSTTPGNLGAWEGSGIVDVSSVYGPGTFLINVQAHSLWV